MTHEQPVPPPPKPYPCSQGHVGGAWCGQGKEKAGPSVVRACCPPDVKAVELTPPDAKDPARSGRDDGAPNRGFAYWAEVLQCQDNLR
ncbi:Hypp9578 [Branchiostoma lanceolatum]|uniref:Hypp9578 protein n=1 Tax=Branchiostoma lanceolatum TaxID=7740 RepID=A0A8S4MNI7_BRALA|nr:Hypp9578 [Branchiostoma lanceolatum]